ncbi:MAG: hypothetical protein LC708_02490, partial [Actinobacteria bacterium]|nr:hypothetical protein [Actinomycetota bacterium]
AGPGGAGRRGGPAHPEVTGGALPAPVRRHLRRPLWWAGVALLAACAGLAVDVEAASRERSLRRRALAVEGTVSERYRRGPDVPVAYDNPVTGEHLDVTVRVWDDGLWPEPGAPVALRVDPGDPEHVFVAGDRYPTAANLWWYLPPVALPLLAWAGRRWSLGRARRLVDTPEPSFAMTGAIGPAAGGGRRCHLDVYPLDAAPGAPPLCSVPVLTTGGAPLGPPFPVEVKGGPRPLGRVAARHRDRLLWPGGRATLTASTPRPADPPARTAVWPAPAAEVTAPGGPSTPFRRAARSELLVLASTLAVVALVAMVTLTNARRARAVERHGVPVLARVVGHDDTDGVVLVVYRLPGEETERRGTAAVDFPSDHPVDRLLPARVDPRRPTTLRVLLEPYEAREPILWSLVPAAVAVGGVVRRRAAWRRIRAVAGAGPWYPVEGRVLAPTPAQAAVGLSRPGEPGLRCVVAVPAEDAAGLTFSPVVSLEAAGVLEPGQDVAVRAGDRLLAVTGPATGVPRRRRFRPGAGR